MKNYQLKKYKLRLAKLFFLLCVSVGFISSVNAQSINQSYPTPITSNEISGKIAARDIGDARLTSYFYTFDGTQGDVFINVVTSNFNGDIDVFTADNLKPLTKITIYADDSDNETGRVVYLRQPLKLILRIEGRSPNDDAATFRIKFAGSFVASQTVVDDSKSETPEVKSNNQTNIRVNSVGTIIEVKPTPAPKAATIEKSADKAQTNIRIEKTSEVNTEEKKSENPTVITVEKNPSPIEEKASNEIETKTIEIRKAETDPVVVVTDNLAEEKSDKTNIEIRKDSIENTEPVVEKNAEREITSAEKETVKSKKTTSPKPLPSAALENIRLVILFKDGSKIERPMSEVLKFGIDKGILTVILKDGAIGRYSILDVEKTTIQ